MVDTGKKTGIPSPDMTEDHRKKENISEIIEEMRNQLVKLVQEKGISHSEVLALSQRLDEYIVQYQITANKKSGK